MAEETAQRIRGKTDNPREPLGTHHHPAGRGGAVRACCDLPLLALRGPRRDPTQSDDLADLDAPRLAHGRRPHRGRGRRHPGQARRQRIGVTAIAALALFRGTGGRTGSDFLCLALTGIGVGAWSLLDDPVIGLAVFMIADIAGAVPTLRDTWRDPRREAPKPWLLGLAGSAVNLTLVDPSPGRRASAASRSGASRFTWQFLTPASYSLLPLPPLSPFHGLLLSFSPSPSLPPPSPLPLPPPSPSSSPSSLPPLPPPPPSPSSR